MADRPIIFSAPMIRALLDGRKTMTRRIIKPPKWSTGVADFELHDEGLLAIAKATGCLSKITVPFAVGDELWVREAFMPSPMEVPPAIPRQTRWILAYAAGGQDEVVAPADYDPVLYNYERWSSPIHMPRWASRLTLTVTAVKVERLQEISENDAKAEGVEPFGIGTWTDYSENGVTHVVHSPRYSFETLWNKLHGPGSWEANPWVAAISFTVEQRNIDNG